MAKNVTFQLDLSGGADILQNMAAPLVRKSAEAISSRGQAMANSQSSNPPTFSTYTSVGTNKRGKRAIAVVRTEAVDPRQQYIGAVSLRKALDAGKVA